MNPTLKLDSRPKPKEADPTMLKQLVEFGYPLNLAEKALIETRNTGLQPAVDWIDEHRDEEEKKEDMNNQGVNLPQLKPISNPNYNVNVPKQPTTKLISSKYSEEQMNRENSYLEKKKQEEIEEARKKRELQKRNEELIKENLKKQREEQIAQYMGVKIEQPKPTTQVINPNKSYGGDTKCVLQIRIPNSSPIKIDTLQGSATIQELCDHLKEKHNLDYEFSLIFMNKPIHDHNQTLLEAGLVPRAALNVIKDEEKGKVVKGEEIVVNNPNPFGRGRGRGRGFPFNPMPHPQPIINPIDREDGGDGEENGEDGNNNNNNNNNNRNKNVNRNKSIVSIFKQDGDNVEECVICASTLDEGNEIRTLSCLHFFHKECIDEFKQEKGDVCPSCEMEDENN